MIRIIWTKYQRIRQYNQIDWGVWARLWKACMKMCALYMWVFLHGTGSPGSVFFTRLLHASFLQMSFFTGRFFPPVLYLLVGFLHLSFLHNVRFSPPLGVFLHVSFLHGTRLLPRVFYTYVFLQLSLCTGTSLPRVLSTRCFYKWILKSVLFLRSPIYW
jgi:hypothetical protein